MLSERDRHGYDLEQEIRQRNIRVWAKIGASTVYKVLQDLKREECITGQPGTPIRGAGKEVFSITESGRDRLEELLLKALRSESSVYSDRVVGLALSQSIDPGKAERGLAGAHTGLGFALDQLRKTRDDSDSEMAKVILDFYTEVLAAERRAITGAASLLKAAVREPDDHQ